MENYLEINKANWNHRAKLHFESDFYDNETFIAGRNSIPDIDLDLLGDINNHSVLHLQCHFGQDTISLSRMGAKACGVDLSDEAIRLARSLAKTCQTDTEFICTDLYGLPELHDKQYDLCYSSYGTIGWLPDIEKWAEVIARMTKTNGRFVFAEFHPILWMFDNELNYFQYSYFNKGAIEESSEGTYADKDNEASFKSIGWNHSLSEVLQALTDAGFRLEVFREYPYSPYNVFPGMKAIGENRYIVEKFADKMPLVYALVARKI